MRATNPEEPKHWWEYFTVGIPKSIKLWWELRNEGQPKIYISRKERERDFGFYCYLLGIGAASLLWYLVIEYANITPFELLILHVWVLPMIALLYSFTGAVVRRIR